MRDRRWQFRRVHRDFAKEFENLVGLRFHVRLFEFQEALLAQEVDHLVPLFDQPVDGLPLLRRREKTFEFLNADFALEREPGNKGTVQK